MVHTIFHSCFLFRILHSCNFSYCILALLHCCILIFLYCCIVAFLYSCISQNSAYCHQWNAVQRWFCIWDQCTDLHRLLHCCLALSRLQCNAMQWPALFIALLASQMSGTYFAAAPCISEMPFPRLEPATTTPINCNEASMTCHFWTVMHWVLSSHCHTFLRAAAANSAMQCRGTFQVHFGNAISQIRACHQHTYQLQLGVNNLSSLCSTMSFILLHWTVMHWVL